METKQHHSKKKNWLKPERIRLKAETIDTVNLTAIENQRIIVKLRCKPVQEHNLALWLVQRKSDIASIFMIDSVYATMRLVAAKPTMHCVIYVEKNK